MNWQKFWRKFHRVVSLVFTATVVANFVALGIGSQATWVGFLAIPPLLLLLGSGLYLYVLPYTKKGKAALGA